LDAGLGALMAACLFLPQTYLTRGRFSLADANFAIFVGAALGLSRGFQALCLGVISGGLVLLILLLAGSVSRRQVTCYAPFLVVSAITIALVRGTAFSPL
jgi:prepilin signal peptidase PulO-like enzyme (type II secretory pathway)